MADGSEEDSSVDNAKNVSIKIKNYMCFGEIPQGFDSIKPINIIIGRNNSGKSRLLDSIEYLVDLKNSRIIL
jgi:AAA15 family ATPase/GTPase